MLPSTFDDDSLGYIAFIWLVNSNALVKAIFFIGVVAIVLLYSIT